MWIDKHDCFLTIRQSAVVIWYHTINFFNANNFFGNKLTVSRKWGCQQSIIIVNYLYDAISVIDNSTYPTWNRIRLNCCCYSRHSFDYFRPEIRFPLNSFPIEPIFQARHYLLCRTASCHRVMQTHHLWNSIGFYQNEIFQIKINQTCTWYQMTWTCCTTKTF